MDGLRMTRDEVAAMLMITPRQVNRLVRRGVLPSERHGEYDAAECAQGYIKFKAHGGPGKGPHDDAVRLARAKADIEEYRAESMRASLVEADVADAVWADAVKRIRAEMLAVPDRLADLLASEGDIEGCARLIELAIHDALLRLSQTEVVADA